MLQSFIDVLPNIFLGIVIILLGLYISKKIRDLVIHFLNRLRLNQMLSSLGWQEFFNRFDTKLDIPRFFGTITQIYFLLWVVLLVLDMLSLSIVGDIISNIINYYPNIFISIVIFIVAVFIADFSKKIIVSDFREEKLTYSNFLGNIIASSVWVIAILAILYQLQIAQTLILIAFIGFIALIVLTVGIAFGLGGKEIAKKTLEDIEKKIK
ncbi:MAG TPA: hypothetical protein PLI02_02005 [Candidatus Pacearchaeota archaeon]|nr:hypothetical protein [Candidatus Pacearchaeota archaeon]HPL72788.1 hypothetical protein [Candidatus Pacearchaeota archaeon]